MPRKDGSTLYDPNADLVGMKFMSDYGPLVVTRTMRGLATYVECKGKNFSTCRSVSLLRAVRLSR